VVEPSYQESKNVVVQPTEASANDTIPVEENSGKKKRKPKRTISTSEDTQPNTETVKDAESPKSSQKKDIGAKKRKYPTRNRKRRIRTLKRRYIKYFYL
jgi:hypothetical protein